MENRVNFTPVAKPNLELNQGVRQTNIGAERRVGIKNADIKIPFTRTEYYDSEYGTPITKKEFDDAYCGVWEKRFNADNQLVEAYESGCDGAGGVEISYEYDTDGMLARETERFFITKRITIYDEDEQVILRTTDVDQD